MNCSLLGSLLNSFCETCVCSARGWFNFSQNRTIVIYNEADPKIARIFEKTRDPSPRSLGIDVQNSPDIVTRFHGRKVIFLRHKDSPEPEKRSLAKLTKAKSLVFKTLQAGEIGIEEKQARLNCATSLAEVPLNQEAETDDFCSITAYESRKLRKQAEVIKQYGSIAAFLWQFLKEYKERDESAEEVFHVLALFSPKQAEYFKKNVFHYAQIELFEPVCFAELTQPCKEFFLKLAEFFDPDFIKKNIYYAWTLNTFTKPNSITLLNNPQKMVEAISISYNSNITEIFSAGTHSLKMALLRKGLIEKINPWIAFVDLKREELSQKTKDTLKKPSDELAQYHGVMQHVFISMQKTTSVDALKCEYGWPKSAYQEMCQLVKKDPGFLLDFYRAKEIGGLHTDSLFILYKIALKIPNPQLYTYPITTWAAHLEGGWSEDEGPSVGLL